MEAAVSALVGTMVAGAFLAAARLRPNLGRTLLALVMLAGSTYNALFTFPNRDWAVTQMVAGQFVPSFYRDVTAALFAPRMAAFVVLVVAFEAGVGLLLLSRGNGVKLGLLAAATFLLAMIPMAPPEGIVVTALSQSGMALSALLLLRCSFDTALPGFLFRPRRSRATRPA